MSTPTVPFMNLNPPAVRADDVVSYVDAFGRSAVGVVRGHTRNKGRRAVDLGDCWCYRSDLVAVVARARSPGSTPSVPTKSDRNRPGGHMSESAAPKAAGALFHAQETDSVLVALRKAVVAYPDDDTPRCAYADRLAELGFPGVANRVLSQVRNRNRRRWVYDYLGSAVHVQYHRGFVDVVGGYLPALKAVAPALFRRHPVREAKIWRYHATTVPGPDEAPRHPLRVSVNEIAMYTYCVPPASYVLSGDRLTITHATIPAVTYQVLPPQGFPGDVRFYFNCAALPQWLADRWPEPDEKNRLPFLYATIPLAEAALAAAYVRYGRWATEYLPDALPKRR